MTKDVVISIRSLHDCGQEEEDSIDFSTDGKYSLEGDVALMSYMESPVTGLDGTLTSVMVTGDRVVVDRSGVVTSRMVFREGEKNHFLYDTPVGSALLGMNTRSIRHSFNEHGGNMEIDYVLDVEHSVVSRNRFYITVTEQKHTGEVRNG